MKPTRASFALFAALLLGSSGLAGEAGSASPAAGRKDILDTAVAAGAFKTLVAGKGGEAPVDAQSVQAYYTGALARAVGMTVAARLDGEDVVIEAVPAVAAPVAGGAV